jgi:hypothetical protein
VANLVENAIAYSPEDTKVVVTTGRPTGLVEIAVADQGIGIAEARPRPDLRAVLPGRPGPLPRHRRHRARPGAIVKHIATNHGGRVDVSQSRATGSTFTLRLPRAPRTAPLPLPAATLRSSPAGHPPSVTPSPQPPKMKEPVARVLVVEDEESFSDALSTCCARRASRSPSRPTGPRGADEFDRNGADIVLLDLMLPGMSGTEVCRSCGSAPTCR